MSKKTKAKLYPPYLYVVRNEEDNNDWFESAESFDGFDDNARVAIYELQDVKTLKRTTKLE